jgi:CBS domain-containing protein
MQATDIMNRSVITIRPDAPILEAIDLMLTRRISGLPVVDQSGQLAGILTEGDLLRRSDTATQRHHSWWWTWLYGPGAQAAEYVRTHASKVADLMTPRVLTVEEHAPLEEIVELMEHRRIKRVAVVDKAGVLVGVVSRSDLLRALAEAIRRTTPLAPDCADAALSTRLSAELNQQDWFRKGQIQVEVAHGVVRLSGVYTDPRERDAVRVAAENTPGVKAVQDDLEFFDPNRGLVYG